MEREEENSNRSHQDTNRKDSKKTIKGRKEREGDRSCNRSTPYMVRSFLSENVFELQVGDDAAEAGRILVILCRT